LGVFPTKSLVQNIGFDGSGENCGVDNTHKVFNFFNNKPELFKKEEMDLHRISLVINFMSIPKKILTIRSCIKSLFFK